MGDVDGTLTRTSKGYVWKTRDRSKNSQGPSTSRVAKELWWAEPTHGLGPHGPETPAVSQTLPSKTLPVSKKRATLRSCIVKPSGSLPVALWAPFGR